MKKQHIWMVILMIGVVIASTSCRKKQHVEVSVESMTFGYAGGTDVFQIEADCDWTIEKDGEADWIEITPTQGTNNATVSVMVKMNTNSTDRSSSIRVVSANGKVKRVILITQAKVDITLISNKYWFLYFYERWATDYYNQPIPEEYRTYNYYSNEGYENWFFYFFNNNRGYQLHTHDYDTVIYQYDYVYYPDGDSLYINFDTYSDSLVEDYHVVVQQLDSERLLLRNEYRPHQFEKLTMANVSSSKRGIYINPKKIKPKPRGPLIPID